MRIQIQPVSCVIDSLISFTVSNQHTACVNSFFCYGAGVHEHAIGDVILALMKVTPFYTDLSTVNSTSSRLSAFLTSLKHVNEARSSV